MMPLPTEDKNKIRQSCVFDVWNERNVAGNGSLFPSAEMFMSKHTNRYIYMYVCVWIHDESKYFTAMWAWNNAHKSGIMCAVVYLWSNTYFLEYGAGCNITESRTLCVSNIAFFWSCWKKHFVPLTPSQTSSRLWKNRRKKHPFDE